MIRVEFAVPSSIGSKRSSTLLDWFIEVVAFVIWLAIPAVSTEEGTAADVDSSRSATLLWTVSNESATGNGNEKSG